MACVESSVYLRKRGRVVECTGLENRRWATIREFESHRFRQTGIIPNSPARDTNSQSKQILLGQPLPLAR